MEQNGFLFSAVTFEASPLARWWEPLLPAVQERFPHLKAKAVADLHVTLVYVGRWNASDLPVYRSACLVAPREGQELLGVLHRFGVAGGVLGLDLRGFTESWAREVIAAREDLARASLKGWGHHDGVFRPHVSLVECNSKRPTAEELAELGRCDQWLAAEIPAGGLPVAIPAGAPTRLLVASAARGQRRGYALV